MVSEAIEMVQIVVDDRERPSGVVAELEKLDGVIVKMEHLVVGDYCIDGAVLNNRAERYEEIVIERLILKPKYYL